MNRKFKWIGATLFLCLTLAVLWLSKNQAPLSDFEIKNLLRDRIDRAKQSVGIVVGLVDEKGVRVISYGSVDKDGGKKVDGDTVFEIGSITKVFTATLLADMVGKGELKLEDAAEKFLPKTVKLPSMAGKEITLLNLTAQNSGLPRMPGNFHPKDAQNPFADYTVAQMYSFLSGYKLTREPGAKYEYSNLGVGLLGHILALRAGMDYEALVLKRICIPLGMANTRVTLTPVMQANLALGHDFSGRQVANWDLPTFAGAGALRSTANDMLKFAAANLGLKESPLSAAMTMAHRVRFHDIGLHFAASDIGMNWIITKKYRTEMVWHNGGTGGYHTFIGLDQARRKGVVVLSNSSNDIDDIGRHLIEPRFALNSFAPPKIRVPITLDAKILETYVGQYQITPKFIIAITRQGAHLFQQCTGQGMLELYGESNADFFLMEVDAQFTFVKDAKGQVSHLVLHQNGKNKEAKKIK